ncbi:LCP family protein [Streptomyces sp. NPDC006172]|uniref:LCP family protein n=1 Tax=Streptomyces sp. NPDC006172 TaxID=3154470 RepID=UPI0033F425F2
MSDPWDGGGQVAQATRDRRDGAPGRRAAAPDATVTAVPSTAVPGRRGGRGSRRARRAPLRRGMRALRIAGLCVALLVLGTAGAGWWFLHRLDGNIDSVSLDGKGGTEKADAFGRTPINILVMGSDGRNSEADCRLGGGCAKTGVQSGNGNADVQMVVHIAADRSDATVMSIPRDTMTDVPACEDPGTGRATPAYFGQINSALRYGPACQVATVHQLTGIPIDHFVKMDFSGVVKMSDAVGGVPVCVSGDVYDTYSHLKLSKGTHTLKGEAALQFVRSRHGFGDGSDLGRTVSQHIFLSAMIRKFQSAGTLTDPAAVYRLADAATEALTVDDGLGGVDKLIGLAADVNKVPTDRMTFTTMQTAPDPDDDNRVVVAPGARSLFAAIADDRPLAAGSPGKPATPSGAAPSPSASASGSGSASASGIAVTVENGSGITGRASDVATALTERGFSPGTTTANAPESAAATTLTYGTGQRAEAGTVAEALGLPASHLRQGSGTGLTLVIGADWPSGSGYPGGAPASQPAGGRSAEPRSGDGRSAVSDAHASTAGSKRCATVSPYKTVALDGVAMTPAQAYAAAADKPDSDD